MQNNNSAVVLHRRRKLLLNRLGYDTLQNRALAARELCGENSVGEAYRVAAQAGKKRIDPKHDQEHYVYRGQKHLTSKPPIFLTR